VNNQLEPLNDVEQIALLTRLRASLEGVVRACKVHANSQTAILGTEAMTQLNQQYGQVLGELKRFYPGAFFSVAPIRIADYHFNSRSVNWEFLPTLQGAAEYALTQVEGMIAAAAPAKQEMSTTLDLVCRILRRFSSAYGRLTSRPGNRKALLQIADEKDLQDLIHAFLQLHFDDIRREEAVPSSAGATSRIDFLLKSEKIGIEVKGPREGLTDIRAGAELVEDIFKYSNHPDCRSLVFFVYDPFQSIGNPAGIVHDLREASTQDFQIHTVIVPPRH
jgi:hypothetical protein